MKPLVLLNPAAHYGRARERFSRIRHRVDALGATVIESTGVAEEDFCIVKDALEDGCTLVIAGGGDGTVHSVVNALWRIGKGAIPAGVYFGAIGLGSSNDFHKPYRADVPVLMRIETAAPRDLVLCRLDCDGSPQEEICVVSASFGATAQANEFFNANAGFFRHLKRSATAVAIAYAALHATKHHHNMVARLDFSGEELEVELSNLSILKTPYLSGSLRFDLAIEPDDGLFAVAMCEGMSRLRLCAALFALYRGKFSGRSGTKSWKVQKMGFKTDRAVTLEIDGEITRASSATFLVQPGALMTCGV